MSASLVGSEMCIRDRKRGPPRCEGSRVRHWGSEPPSRRSRTRYVGHPGAVSYTHLTLPTICSV
eukprot:355516-Alexandrium_andersonii.AAC.1